MNCLQCSSSLDNLKNAHSGRKFCNQTCSALYNNKGRKYKAGTKQVNCTICSKLVTISKSCALEYAKFFCCTMRKTRPSRAKLSPRVKKIKVPTVAKIPKVLLVDAVRPGAKVYGPYKRADGRKHVVILLSDKSELIM